MNLQSRPEGCFRDGSRWYLRARGQVMGPFSARIDARMAQVYFRQRLKWPSQGQLREFIATASGARAS